MDPAWHEYRRRRRAFRFSCLIALLWMVPGSLIRFLLDRYGLDDGPAFLLAVGLPIMAIIANAHIRKMFCPCPRCGRPFHIKWYYGNAFARRCVHCGLPLWTPVPAQTDVTSCPLP